MSLFHFSFLFTLSAFFFHFPIDSGHDSASVSSAVVDNTKPSHEVTDTPVVITSPPDTPSKKSDPDPSHNTSDHVLPQANEEQSPSRSPYTSIAGLTGTLCQF